MTRIGLIDGALPQDWPGLTVQARFCEVDGTDHACMHATAMARTVQAHAGEVSIVNAAVFPGRLATSLHHVRAALHWLADNPPDIVLCAFGLARSSVDLGLAVSGLQQAGATIIASAPARGGPIYPAGLYGVMSVQGDARCAPGDLSRLDLPHAVFGACPQATGAPDIRGASAAAAHVAGLLAACEEATTGRASSCLETYVRYRGRERRG